MSALLNDLPRRGDVAVIANGGLVCAPVVGAANRTAVERGLFRDLKSASDGWVDRYLNRQFSPWFSRWFLGVPLTPNQVTVIAFAIGLIAAFGFAHGRWFGGVVGALPITGVPLPFISVGGNAMIVNLAMMGVLLNIARSGVEPVRGDP